MGKIVPIEIPPGVYRNGTEYQARNRWRATSLVRGREGSMKPIGGWGILGTNGAYADTGLGSSDPPSFGIGAAGGVAWVDDSGNRWALFSMTIGAIVYDIDNGRTYGLSSGLGEGEWSWDTFGEIPIGCNSTAGNIVEWDLNTANNLTNVTNAPSSCRGVVVADENFIFALGAGGEARRVEWCDRGDRTVWTAAATNQAGGFTLDGEGAIVFALQMRGEVLIVTESDCWTAQYVGYPDVWSFQRIGSCTAISANAGARVNDVAYWMGENEFYVYQGGYVQKLPCDVSEHVFPNISTSSTKAIFAWNNVANGELWWHYPVSGTAANRAVVFSYVEDHWATHDFTTNAVHGPYFTSIISPGVYPRPLGLSIWRSGVDEDFSSNPGMTLGTNWQVSGGTLNQSAPTASDASYGHTTSVGLGYVAKVTTTGRTAGTLSVTFGSSSQDITTDGEYYLYVTAASGATTTITFSADGTYDGAVTRMLINQEAVFELEKDTTFYHGGTTPYAKSGPLELAPGERRVHVTRLLPDEQDAGELQFTFASREYPTGTETTYTAVTATNPTSVRFSGRQFTMKVEPATAGTDWRSGTHRLEVTPGGKR